MSSTLMALAFVFLAVSACASIEAVVRESYTEMVIALVMAFIAGCCLMKVVFG